MREGERENGSHFRRDDKQRNLSTACPSSESESEKEEEEEEEEEEEDANEDEDEHEDVPFLSLSVPSNGVFVKKSVTKKLFSLFQCDVEMELR